MKIAVWYSGLFFIGSSLVEQAQRVVSRQMQCLDYSGLRSCATEIHVGINGTPQESGALVKKLIPSKAHVFFNGLDSRSENKTMIALQDWLPGHEDWYVFYHHAKTGTYSGVKRWEGDNLDADYERMGAKWLNCMMKHCVNDWRLCVWHLDQGYEAVGAHWMRNQADGTQNYFAGNFFWAKASFLLTLPPVANAYREAADGVGSLRARYESECWIGQGPRLPKVKDLVTGHQLWHCP